MTSKVGFFLKEWRERSGVTQEKVAGAVGKSVPTVQRWEAGVRTPGIDDVQNIADFLGLHPADLLRPPLEVINLGAGVEVRGAVQAGVWRESTEWPDDMRYRVPMPPEDPRYPGIELFGLEVRGNSMDKVFPPGTILGCLHLIRYPVKVDSGRYVIAERVSETGEIEATVKQFEIDDSGNAWLWPRSNDPRYQAPIPINDGVAVRITALVVRSSKPE